MSPSLPPSLLRAEHSRKVLLGGLPVAVLAVVLLLLPSAAAVGRGTAMPLGQAMPTSVAWSNGAVLCQFAIAQPTVNVSAVSVPGPSVVSTFGAVVEWGTSGGSLVPVARALASGPWTIQNVSFGDTTFAMQYTGHFPEQNLAVAGAQPLGQVSLTLVYSLPAYAGPAASSHVVTFTVTVSNWSWVTPGDALELSLPFAASGPMASPFVLSSGQVSADLAQGGSAGQMYVRPGTEVQQVGAGGTVRAEPVAPTIVLAPSLAVVKVNLTGAGGLTAASYTSEIGFSPGTQVLGLPLYDYAAVVGLAGLTALMLAGLTRRIRRTPSDLTYVEEEDA